ncbi:hypothetical protein [Chondromyces apiculatus]|uniref:Uncharacterized protein n=1 Tax=Chondromyces apiculatus DSM 436 TaxID=1192034 RepID=A0A017TC30_9BACT|nr:hypothetical protein [Chondromyces apiculatus]EYF06156.1 Hypothetical protein CAP_2346 [Chondromyces apiculatus DSM 436]
MDALSLFRSQKSDLLGSQQLVIIDEATGEVTSEASLEVAAGASTKASVASALPGVVNGQGETAREGTGDPSLRLRLRDAAERYQRAAAQAQRAQAEYLRVNEACLGQLKRRPVLRPKQITQLEWMTRAAAVQFADALRSCRGWWTDSERRHRG